MLRPYAIYVARTQKELRVTLTKVTKRKHFPCSLQDMKWCGFDAQFNSSLKFEILPSVMMLSVCWPFFMDAIVVCFGLDGSRKKFVHRRSSPFQRLFIVWLRFFVYDFRMFPRRLLMVTECAKSSAVVCDLTRNRGRKC